MGADNKQNNAEVSSQKEFLYADETYQIRGALFSAWKELGPAFKEIVYHRALIEEFSKRKIPHISNRRIDILYNGKKIGTYTPDFVAFDKIMIELKALPFISKLEEKQIWYYLKGSRYKLALLVNFGEPKLNIKRWIYDKAREKFQRKSA